MSSQTLLSTKAEVPAPPPDGGEVFIDMQLGRTTQQVQFVDLLSAVMVLAIGGAAFFLVSAVLDAWVVPGGLGFWTRLVLSLAAATLAVTFVATRLLPPLAKRVNPLYSAKVIELGEPTLQNGLINFLFVRGRDQAPDPTVLRLMERQTATHLTRVQAESVVDRTKLIRQAIALLGIVSIACLYTLLSPKSPITTVQRLAAPWADIPPPSRVTIRGVSPGDAEVYFGDRLPVVAQVDGLRVKEEVEILYSTQDGQHLDSPIPMEAKDPAGQFTAQVPGLMEGIRQDASYRVRAGDALSPRYTIKVLAAPTIVVDRVEYRFPDYTGLPQRVVEGSGSIKALEGTFVTIHASSSEPIQAAHVDLAADGRFDMEMQSEGSKANAAWVLTLPPDHRGISLRTHYEVRFKTASGVMNPRPIRYPLQILPDLPPEVEIVDPRDSRVELPVNRAIELRLQARDDFALAGVNVTGSMGGRQLFERAILQESRQGLFTARFSVVPEELKLKPGDTLFLTAQAWDSRAPTPNRAETARGVEVVVVEPEPDPQGEPPQALSRDRQGQQSGDSQGGQGDSGGSGQSGDNEGKEADQGQPERGSSGGDRESTGSDNGAGKQPKDSENSGNSRTGSKESPTGEGTGQAPRPETLGSRRSGDREHQSAGTENSREQGDRSPDSGREGNDGEPAAQSAKQQGEPRRPADHDGKAVEIIQRHLDERNRESGGSREDFAETTPGRPDPSQPPDDTRGSERANATSTESDATSKERASEVPRPDLPADPRNGAGGDPRRESPGPNDQRDGAKDEQRGPGRTGGDRQEHGNGSESARELDTARGGEGAAPHPGDRDESEIDRAPQLSPPRGEDPADRGATGTGENEFFSRPGDRSTEPSASHPRDGGAAGPRQPPAAEASRSPPGDDSSSPSPAARALTDGSERDGPPGRGDSRESERKETPGAGAVESPQDGKGAPREPRAQRGQEDSRGKPSGSAGQPAAGAAHRGDPSAPPSDQPLETPADPPNLEYARQVMNLVLQGLQKEMDGGRKESALLDKLGWNSRQLRDFTRRWEEMRAAAQRPGPEGDAARRELDRALLSLGLVPGGTRRTGENREKDNVRELQEGLRIPAPAKYQEAFRAFQESIARPPTSGER